MKKYILFLLFVFVGNLIQAQDETRALIYLKDGSTLRAVILEQKPEGIKVRLSGGAEVDFAMAEVAKIKENGDRYAYFDDGSMSKQRGFYHEFGGQLTVSGLGEELGAGNFVFGFGGQYAFGYRVNKYAAFGGGVGLRRYDTFFGDAFVQARAFLPTGKVTPTFSAEAGYGIPLYFTGNNNQFETQRGGWSLRPSAGLRIATRRRADILLEAGYQFQHTTTEQDWGWGSTNNFEVWYQRLSFRCGWLF